MRTVTSHITQKLLVAAMAVAVCAGAAQADILLTSGPIYDVFMTDPVAVGDGSEDLVAFDLKIVNTTGDAGYDASEFDGVTSGYTGITSGVFDWGPGLHQHYSTSLQASTPTLDGTYPTAIDTHFNDVLANMLVVTAPSETVADIGPSAESSDASSPFDLFANTDFGSQLTGTFAAPAAASLSLAQIVIKDPGGPIGALVFGNGLVSLDFFISGANGGQAVQMGLGFLIGPDPAEPATMGMLVMGAVAVLRRRKR